MSQSDFAFTTSPVISGVVGEDVTIGTTNDDVKLGDGVDSIDSSLVSQSQVASKTLPLSLDEVNEYFIHSAGYMLPNFPLST